MKFITIATSTDGYSVDQCGHTITAGELINYLQDFDEDTKIYLSNSDGYTYGAITYSQINVERVSDDDE